MEQRIVTTTDQSTHKLPLKNSVIRGYEMKRKEKKGTLAQIWQGGGKMRKNDSNVRCNLHMKGEKIIKKGKPQEFCASGFSFIRGAFGRFRFRFRMCF